jgi:hypothetical protein
MGNRAYPKTPFFQQSKSTKLAVPLSSRTGEEEEGILIKGGGKGKWQEQWRLKKVH